MGPRRVVTLRDRSLASDLPDHMLQLGIDLGLPLPFLKSDRQQPRNVP